MVTILHGEDTVASREALRQLRQEKSGYSILEFREGDLADFIRLADGVDLFAPRKLIQIEIAKAQSLKGLPYLTYLNHKPETTEVVFWIGDSIPPRSDLLRMAQDRGWRTLAFSSFDRKIVFRFLDRLFEQDEREAFSLLARLVAAQENLFGIFSLVVSQLRSLLWTKYDLPNLHEASSFIVTKRRRQAGRFSEEGLIRRLTECARLDLALKVGDLDPSLALVNLVQLICHKNAN